MTFYDIAWPLLIRGALLIEGLALFADRDAMKEGTLSVHLRRWFRTDTHVGRNIWAALWCAFAGWMLLHILRLA